MAHDSRVAHPLLEDGCNNAKNVDPKRTELNDERTFLPEEGSDAMNDEDPKATDGIVGAPEVGMAFKSYEEVLEFYRRYALHVGFDVRVKRTTFTDAGQHYTVEFMCHRGGKGRADPSYQSRPTAKTNCQAMIQLKLQGDGLLHLKRITLEHNHPVDPSLVKFRIHRRKLSVPLQDNLDNGNAGVKKVRRYRRLAKEKEIEDSGVEGKECRTPAERGHLKLPDEDIEAIYQFFTHMQTKNPNSFYMVDLDKECRLRNVFWADAMSRAAYRNFGDIVLFDTTYLTTDYDVPLALFLGINNHGQLVLLGCGLLSDDTAETYIWLFKTWLACMSEHPPDALITDHLEAVRDSVGKVFPGTCHRLCLWQLMKRIPKNLKTYEKYKEIKKALNKVVYSSYNTEEFEDEWRKMIEGYGLENNGWLIWLYENRHSWAPVYLKDKFWAGLSISQQSSSCTSFFDGLLHPETTLKQFLGAYESALENKYEKQVQADIESSRKSPILVSKFYMEEQLAELYTYNMFKEFQDELRATMYCDIWLVREDGPYSVYGIKESVFLEDGNVAEYKVLEVFYNMKELEVRCPCGSFELRGILCRHALSVFKIQQLYEIPSQYIIDRWKKDFKQLHRMAHSSSDYVAKGYWERYYNLATHCLQLVDVGMTSDTRCHLALTLMREVEKVLLNVDACGNTQFRIVPCETRANENAENHVQLPHFSNSESDKVLSSPQVKRRGRPPKRKKESNADVSISSNKKMEAVGRSFGENQCNMMLAAPSHLGTHDNSQESMILMGRVNPNDLSLGSHYGIHVNQEDQSDSQPRMLPSDMLQAQFDQQSAESPSRVSWIYQQMLQDPQLPTRPPGQRLG
ncbi:protein FAR1-RELATED SEQUENCE 6-like [Typha latifolia]|uniref:protein FAR1-RELATED SEQUENCE 6-like n=1 Tax=Typha latifolia TaxID=4733 RepID=UPI003C2E7554